MSAMSLKEAIDAMLRSPLPQHRYWHRIVRERADIQMPPRGQRPTGYCVRDVEGRIPRVGDLIIARSYAVTATYQVRSGSHALFQITDMHDGTPSVISELQTTTLGPILRRALALLPEESSNDPGEHRAAA